VDKGLRELSWRVEEGKEREILEELLEDEQSRLVIEEFRKNGITEPCLEEGAVFVDKERGEQYASIPFKSPKTGEVYGALEKVGGHVQGVYVPLAEEHWDNFTVVIPGRRGLVSEVVPWTAFRDPRRAKPMLRRARDLGFATIKPAQREVIYRGLYLTGASRIATLNKAIGYYMMIAVCAV